MRPIGNRETDLGEWWLATTLRLIRASGRGPARLRAAAHASPVPHHRASVDLLRPQL